jgi:DNA-binding LacI/PurR family transcriptional regulator
MHSPEGKIEAMSLRRVAELAGVSRMSASRALRGADGVGEAVRARVLAAAERLGYRQDPLVSELMTNFVRRRMPVHRETFAALWWQPWPDFDAAGPHYPLELRRGLHEGAERHGCKIDEMLIPEKRAGALLVRRMQARGIRGVIITPHPGVALCAPDLAWEKLSAVTIGSTLREPSLNRAQNHHYQAMQRALAEVERRGYRRPVLLMQAVVEEASRRAYLAAFLAMRGADRAADVHPDAHAGDESLAAWVRDRGADVVIAENDQLLAHLAWSFAMPAAIGGVSLDVSERAGTITGIYKDVRRLAACAVDLLLQARWRQETGLPESPLVLMNEGVWVKGTTLRQT